MPYVLRENGLAIYVKEGSGYKLKKRYSKGEESAALSYFKFLKAHEKEWDKK